MKLGINACALFVLSSIVTLVLRGDEYEVLSIDNSRRQTYVSSYSMGAETQRKIMKSIVMVKSSDGVGTGFICNMDGAKWLVTNEHVTRGTKLIEIKNVDGGVVVLETVPVMEKTKKKAAKGKKVNPENDVMIEVATNRDLVRIKIKTELEGLDLSDMLEIGGSVQAFGDSDGAGVVTALSGYILGIGPDKIEVDIPFVQGNSGGPIIGNDGKVLGVVTFATINNEPENWIKTGTRFNDPRRFGVRFNGVQWRQMYWKDYETICKKVADLNTVSLYMYTTCVKPENALSLYQEKNFNSVKDASLRNAVAKILKADKAFKKAFEEESAYHLKSGIAYSPEGLARRERKSKECAESMRKERVSALKNMSTYAKRLYNDEIVSQGLKAECSYSQALLAALNEYMKEDEQEIRYYQISDWASDILHKLRSGIVEPWGAR